jgi:hypothetical protein
MEKKHNRTVDPLTTSANYVYLNLQLLMQSVPITTKNVNLNVAHGEVYLIQHYVIKFDSDL